MASSEMVERVGVAMLIASRKFERDVRLNELTDDEVRMLARAAMLAMREATAGMVHVGASTLDHPSVFMGGPSHQSRRTAPRIWTAMLDQALAE